MLRDSGRMNIQTESLPEIVGCQNLSLDDGEVDFHLIQPTGVDRNQGRPLSLQAGDGFLAAMTGAIVHDPKDTGGRGIGLLTHDLSHPSVEGSDAGLQFTAPEHSGPAHVPSRQVSVGATPLVLMLHVLGAVRLWRQRRMATLPNLDAGLLVRAQDAIRRSQREAVPDPFVKIENPSGLGKEGGVAGKNPSAETPGSEGILAEPTPKGCPADFADQSFGQNLTADFGQREARQRKPSARGEFTSQSLNLDDDAGGKSGLDARPEAPPRCRADVPNRSAFATC